MLSAPSSAGGGAMMTGAYPYYNGAPIPPPYFTTDKMPIASDKPDITIPRSPVYRDEPACISDLVTGVTTQTRSIWHANIDIGINGWVDLIAALPPDEC